jgi:hypothetical protein
MLDLLARGSDEGIGQKLYAFLELGSLYHIWLHFTCSNILERNIFFTDRRAVRFVPPAGFESAASGFEETRKTTTTV